MKNKKVLNISILLLSLLTLVAEIFLFAFPAFAPSTAVILKVIFWLLNSVALIVLVANIIVCLIALFLNDYVCSKLNETAALAFLCISFIITLIFAGTGNALTFGYIVVLILAFVTSNISQIARLINSITTWMPSIRTLLKIEAPKNIIDATNKKCKKEKKEETEEPVVAEITDDIIAPIYPTIVNEEPVEEVVEEVAEEEEELEDIGVRARVTAPTKNNKIILTGYDD